MKAIDIKTTQNVTIEYELASLRDRFFAFFIDLLIVFSGYMIIFFAFTSGDVFDSSLGYFFVSLFPIACFIFYHLFSEILANGQSLGKKAIGLKVVRLDGQEPNLSDYLLRAIFHIADTIFSSGIVAALLISSSRKGQRLGDMTANTTVIRAKSSLRFHLEDILNINTLEDYKPTYPDVRMFNEKDMLLIKTAISRYRKYRNQAHEDVVDILVNNVMEIMNLTEQPKDKIGFLKTLIRDYIVLTR